MHFLFFLAYKWGGEFLDAEIIVAVLSFLGTIVGSIAGVYATSRLSNYRIQQLEKKVDRHNNLIERVYLLERQEAVLDNKINTCDHRIADLEQEHRA